MIYYKWKFVYLKFEDWQICQNRYIISVTVVAIESVSIVGLVVVPRTCKGFGILISSMAKGLNYKLKAGSKITFKLDAPVYVEVSDVLSK